MIGTPVHSRGRQGLHDRVVPALVVPALAVALLAIWTTPAHAQKVRISASGEMYAGLPFALEVSAMDFAEEPNPTVEEFTIPGAAITYLGMAPKGRRRTVTFVYRYRVLVEKPGSYQVPAITVSQGGKQASSSPASFQAKAIATSRDMRLQINLPDRPVAVGETFEMTIDWYLRRQPQGQDFVIPLFDKVTWVDVHQVQLSPLQRRKSISVPSGDREIFIPYTEANETLNGLKYTRLRFKASITPIKAGTLEIPPARVVAHLEVGQSRGFFQVVQTQRFKAEGKAHTLEIEPLPLQGRPVSFANAVGTSYSIQVSAARTVVKFGDPVELDILIRGDGRLEGLSLPKLSHAEGLRPGQFSVPEGAPAGQIVELGQDAQGNAKKGKRFRVVARLESADVRGIPPIAFSYYNPTERKYETVRSQPIALSVEGSTVIGANQVVRSQPKSGADGNGDTSAPRSQSKRALNSLVGADLSLSAVTDTLSAPLSVAGARLLLYLLYGLPLLILAVRLWQLTTRASRDEKNSLRRAHKAVHSALAEAREQPARTGGTEVVNALRALAKACGRGSVRGESAIERIESSGYDPRLADDPLPGDLLDEAGALADRWLAQASDKAPEKRNSKSKGGKAATAAVALLAALTWPTVDGMRSVQAAEADSEVTLEAARKAYQDALAITEREARTAAFARSERMFRQLVETAPASPALATDWGNAALGAQDIGRATLAYRRAMALHPRQERARRNLSWVRERMPEWLPTPEAEDASDSLFFWHHMLTLSERHIIAGVAFAAAVLLLIPWGRRQRALRRLAILPGVVWVAMIASIMLDRPPLDQAVVVVDETRMLSADSAGAPPVLPKPLPAGTEITVLEDRDPWVRVALADGTKGWVQSTSVENVLPR